MIKFRVVFFLLVLLILDLIAFQGISLLTVNYSLSTRVWVNYSFWAVSFFVYILVFLTQSKWWSVWHKHIRSYSISIIFIIIASKLLFNVFVLADDIITFTEWGIFNLIHLFSRSGLGDIQMIHFEFIIKTGLAASLVLFVAMFYGMLFNAYKYKVKKISLVFPHLPHSFDGFRILQISDLHLGSFLNAKPLTRAVDIMNEQKADLVFFTGDLVNNKFEEALPYVEVLGRIEAKYGVFSVFGNHDYGDYTSWQNAEYKQNNVQKLREVQKNMGWDLLWDEHRTIEINGEHISVIGVQNCRSRGSKSYGSLQKATENINYSQVNLLLSHDPIHWEKEVINDYPNIDLTLSGHTHGMQFGIELAGIKWSPIQYFYKEWAGLYKKNNQYLHVNTGLGFIGYHGRVGFLPEITLIELKKS